MVLARSTVAPLLREDVDRPTRSREGEPLVPPRAREVVEVKLASIEAELDRLMAETELANLDVRRRGVLARIAGRS